MRFLITGGAGFIGSHLSDLLIEHGHAVHVLDDLSTGGIENIRHLKHRPRFEYTIDSAEDHAVVAELVDEASTSSCTWRPRSASRWSSRAPCARSRPTCTAPRWCSRTPTRRRSPC